MNYTNKDSWNEIFAYIRSLNPNISERRKAGVRQQETKRPYRLQKVLVANRGEIAKRFFFALHEEGIPSVAIVTNPDIGQSWYEFADEAIHIGDPTNYTNIPVVIAAALLTGANAIYPGYGFLSENAEFVSVMRTASELFEHNIIFMGPEKEVMDRVSDKVKARLLAKENGVPLLEGADDIKSLDDAIAAGKRIGYPVMVKLSAGGGGRGIIPCFNEPELIAAVEQAQRMGKSLYNDDTYYVEKFVEKPVHMEVQIFNEWAIGIRKCAVQRRNQKIIEESGHTLVDDSTALSMLAQAQKIAQMSGYSNGCGAGTVEYLFDAVSGKFGFLEMNTRLQVEYAVTEQALGIDLVKWQILNFDGRGNEINYEEVLKSRILSKNHSIECRIYAEEPQADYRPSPGLISEMVLPTFNGVRCDIGFKDHDNVCSMYDAMIGKIVAYGSSRAETLIRLERALQEIYIKGFNTNIKQLLAIVRHPKFIAGDYTNKLLDEFPDLHGKEVKYEDDPKGERRGRYVLVLGTLAEYIKLVRKKAEEFALIGNYEVSLENKKNVSVPYRFSVVYHERKFMVEVYQTSLEKYYVMIDGEYNGKVHISKGNVAKGDFIFRYGSRSYRIRTDKRTKHIAIRLKDGTNKVNYHRLQINPIGSKSSVDPAGMTRSPFQCTFVSLGKDPEDQNKYISIGSNVNKGDVLLIISSMKMETKILAPASGKIEYIIEDGNLSKLITGKTSDGRILGKSIQEGDVLVLIKPTAEESAEESESDGAEKKAEKTYPTTWFIYEKDMEARFTSKPSLFMPLFLELITAHIKGFVHRESILNEILAAMDKVEESRWTDVLTEDVERKMCEIISFYYNILKLFSPILRSGLSLYEEFNYYIKNISNFDYKPSYIFKDLMTKILESYGITEFRPSLEGETNFNLFAFMNIQHSYYVCMDNKVLIKKLVEIIAKSKNRLPETAETLSNLMQHEMSELDDTLAFFTRKILNDNFPEKVRVADEIADRSEFTVDSLLKTIEGSGPVEEFKKSLSAKISAAPGTMKEEYSSDLSEKIKALGVKNNVYSLYSPLKNVAVFSVEAKEGGAKYFAAYACVSDVAEYIATCQEYRMMKYNVIEDQLVNAFKVVSVYNLLEQRSGNRVDILAFDTPVEWDSVTNGIGFHNFLGLKGLVMSLKKYMGIASSEAVLLHFDVRFGKTKRIRKVFEITRKDSGFSQDLLAERDFRNPYFTGDNSTEMNIYRMAKWPIDIWARECFDPDSFEEILVDSIDTDPKLRVASKIYIGDILGKKACFYMKDSRINGGATGDIEGLKYLAAVYITYLKGMPLYVWNDGAGANILQGMVSLVRGAEGFMMNTISANMGLEEFIKYCRGCADPKVTDLFLKLDNQFFKDGHFTGRRYHYVTAIGVGSSAGLDVYGSSQAPIQVIWDSEQSYRVLTGSNVIKSAMGEIISNYDIGGARVMSKWAGIVDVVAADKFNLVASIRNIHGMFSYEDNLPSIVRDQCEVKPEAVSHFSEETIIANVDRGEFIPFKKEYYGGGTLVAGFAKIGGRKVLIMGPRSDSGIRYYAAVTRARELMSTAARIGVHPILVLGKKWHQDANIYDSSGTRARIDFINTLAEHKGLKMCVITDIQGFQAIDLLSNCNVHIFVKKGECNALEKEFIDKNSTFVVDSIEKAFDLCHKLIGLVDPVGSAKFSVPEGPEVSTDTNNPYDMIETVIKKVVDDGDFTEFYSEMNSVKTKPNFITGLARINSKTVGILADQPLILGGGADAEGTEKFRIFVQFLNRFNIPVLMMSNSSGFIPGTKQERLRIQNIGAWSLDENVKGNVPAVSVVLNQNYGGRQIQAYNKFLRPGIHYMARDTSILAVLGHTVAFDLLKSRKYREILDSGNEAEAEKMKKEFIDGYLEKARAVNDATATGAVDTIIRDIKNLRQHIIEGFVKAEELCRNAFGK